MPTAPSIGSKNVSGAFVTRTDRFGRTISQSPDKADRVDIESILYSKMKVDGQWELMKALLGGTQFMRDESVTWLPKHEAEEEKFYRDRIQRSFLFNGFRDTIEKLAAKPFSKPLTINKEDELVDPLAAIRVNVDKAGRNLAALGKEMLIDALTYGKTHVLIDFPKMFRGATLEDERAPGVRPLFIHIKAPQIFAWRFGHDLQLDQIRIRETRILPKGEFSDEEVNFIRVFNRTTWQLWREFKEKDSKIRFILVEEGENSLGRIPLVTFFVSQTGSLTSKPPFLDLAWLNLAHWQSSSDQRNILRVARVSILFGTGFNDEDIEAGITLGPNNMIAVANESATLKHVEHSGKAIASGQEDLDKLEFQMELLGLQPLIKKTGVEKATGQAINESKTQAAVQTWIQDLEAALVQAYKFAAEWLNEKLPENFDIDIFSEFSITLKSKDDIDQLLKIWIANGVDHQTFLTELKRRALLAESVNIEEVIEAVGNEGPSLESIGVSNEEEEEEENG